ncbi:hypothetical protein A8924_6142 [Saccharopolyspora erythraea NRRL 2338]|uniref:CAAX amino terminal protease family n=2 Tax=Saccharopolyspora erythraea TaxID=1836 RepID=A4FLQ9_SACEN|nr:type II CAAX endopeptidase family protein [Saccharopolyspora erythraea]EQD88148.1 CAAX amino terminal protease [Saccharopolyspora erythraea D]PFG98621.1 hypothetical protein A8924_6142 [Saccharopolyspora erythraea NRRL 2338]QRK88654.1 CPBP family intramembrane metalloprotease [Saccharopolyspora erythraea]CAM04984.1 CAAX amino terminal protease family [Saccharopolyspora erythraea NRRL 2338]
MRTAATNQPPSELLSGIFLARRPTGPIVALLVVLAALVVGQALVLIPFAILGGDASGLLGGRMGLDDQLVMTFSFAGAAVLLLLWIRFKERRPVGSVGFRPATRVPARLLLGAGVALAALVLPVLVNLASGQFTLDEPVFRAAHAGGVLLALAGFAVQGSTEEIVSRGYLMQTAYRRWGLTAAVVFQLVVFTALHGANVGVGVVPLLNLVLISLLLAFWALAEGGLWGVCAFHVVWNWAQGNVFGVEVSGMNLETTLLDTEGAAGSSTLLTGGAFGIEGSLVTSAVLAVGVVVAAQVFRRRRHDSAPA